MKAVVYTGRSGRSGGVQSMTCDCGVTMRARITTLQAPYAYDISGLKGVALAGITVWKCPACGAESPVIPKIGELHRVIAEALVRKPGVLSGEEIRFLRKNAGFAAKDFARLLEITPSHLSRVETGKPKYEALSAQADRLARAVVMAATDCEEVRGFLLKLAKDQAKTRKSPVFELTRNRWRPAA